MRYFPLTDHERQEMKQIIGISDVSELFACIAAGQCQFPAADLPPAASEPELLERFNALTQSNTFFTFTSFLGGGAYRHFIPEAINFLSSKGEFVTPYTPYQPEVSQGSLQAMFEYQTMITGLTGLDVANSSLYDGGTAAAEAALLVMRKSGRKKVLLAASLHPEYGEIVRTFVQNLDCRIETVAYDPLTGAVDPVALRNALDDQTAGFLFQSPNFFGVVEDGAAISAAVHEKKAYAVQVVAEAISLGYLAAPGANGVDVAVGEAQSFGLPLGFGGPYLGFMAAREEFLRQMPGRIVGQTKDVDGKRAYVLTLSTREQHIKREKATSNICSNQAWCALRAGMYLSVMGRRGLAEVAGLNHINTVYFVERVMRYRHVKVRFSNGYYSEVVLETPDADRFLAEMKKRGILAGIPLKWFYPEMPNAVLLNFTEVHKQEEIDRLVAAIGELQ